MPEGLNTIHPLSSPSPNIQNWWILSVSEDIMRVIGESHHYAESINPDEHPSHFLGIYDEEEELLWYLQYWYFAPNWYKPFYYIANLENLSNKIGIGKKLMNEFLLTHSRVFLDDNAHINWLEAKWYYRQFGFIQLYETNIWYTSFTWDDREDLPLLYTRTIFWEIRKSKRESDT